ncbi:MAG: glutaredoxin family protein [Microbacteriaceae bacterium]
MSVTRLTLIGKPGCHLCDDARTVMVSVASEFEGVEILELSILDEPDLFEKYSEEIPVLLLNGAVHNIWRINPERLRAALRKATQ